ncbi:hypothetical protein O181_110071 [Austropuccinia psidii MF-1]|uniref:Uncharacterized protein n=1 Tax=Austropuccinia psidii MF-1 TaxID=1389203 RepID=A0A9Q3JYG6_9BASI|nr:hypothetical protein [Austropuccinia psidii MF-1]
MRHLFLAQVHPLNHLGTLRLVSQNQRWLQHNPWRNQLVSPNFSSPLLCPSSAHPATPLSVIIIDDTPVKSLLPFLLPLLPRIFLPFLPRTQLPPPSRFQAPLIPTRTLTRNSPTCDQH